MQNLTISKNTKVVNKLDEIRELLLTIPSVDYLSLASGDSGILLFFVNYYRLFQDDKSLIRIEYLANETHKIILEKRFKTPDFGTGLLGCLWSYRFADNENVLSLPDDFIDKSLEDELFDIFYSGLKEGNYDLFYGATGLSVYLLSCKSNKNVELAHIVRELSKVAVNDSDGIYWEDKLFNITQSKSSVIIGLAHGIPSIITILSIIYEKGIEQDLCFKLVSGSIKWMLSKKYKEKNVSLFPSNILDNTKYLPSRLSWCYGDLGVATSLWKAGNTFDNELWKNEAIEIMLLCSNRIDLKENAVVDAGFCHGTSGIAHIFNRFYLDTKIEKFN